MARMHIHIAVENLDRNIAFYSTLFGVEPSVTKTDYAKWQLDDPRVNFAISTRGRTPGLDHVGIQSDSAEEQRLIEQRLQAADIAGSAQKDATCCYAKSDKYWVQDPQGIAWETFHTLGNAPVFGTDEVAETKTGDKACCVPDLPSTCC